MGRRNANFPTTPSLFRMSHFMTSHKSTTTFFIIILLALTTLTASGLTKPKRNIIVQTLDFKYLEGCETGKGDCKPIVIFRQSKQDSILLIFPSGGTESDVYLRSAKNKNLALHNKKVIGQGKPTLNMTNLDDGEYSACIISCGLGGCCSIRLKTKQK